MLDILTAWLGSRILEFKNVFAGPDWLNTIYYFKNMPCN